MFYDISDVCRLFRLSPNSVRYYESLGLIHPARTSGGRRKYSVEEMCMLLRIKSLQKLGLDLQTIKEQFIDETPFLPEMLFDIMEGKIAQMEQQIRCLQSSVSMLRQYEQRLQEADVSLDQPHTVDLPDIYFLPMDPLFGRSAAEREALAQWLDAIPMMRKTEYYRAKNAGGVVSSCFGYFIYQNMAAGLSLPMLDKAECMQFGSTLKFYCKFPWRSQWGLTAADLSVLICKVREIRPWQNIRVLASYLYGAREETVTWRYYEIWVAEDTP